MPWNTCVHSRGASLLQDEALRRAVDRHGVKNWKAVAAVLPGRTDMQCHHRWQKVLKPGLVKGPWTEQVSEEMDHHHQPNASSQCQQQPAATGLQHS